MVSEKQGVEEQQSESGDGGGDEGCGWRLFYRSKFQTGKKDQDWGSVA